MPPIMLFMLIPMPVPVLLAAPSDARLFILLVPPSPEVVKDVPGGRGRLKPEFPELALGAPGGGGRAKEEDVVGCGRCCCC